MAPRAILLPLPAQGHVIPFLELAYCLADHGVKVTFINTECIHSRVMAAASSDSMNMGAMGLINMVSIPDGLHTDEDRRDIFKVCLSFLEVICGCLAEIVKEMDENDSERDRVVCLIADQSLASVLPLAKELGLYTVTFWPAAAASLAVIINATAMVADGAIDAAHGKPKTDDMIQVRPGMPPIAPSELVWNAFTSDLKIKEAIFKMILETNNAVDSADAIICHSFQELESPTFTFFPKLLPIGPLLPGRRFGKPVGHFWPDDETCLNWLDEQQADSVIYVAFGSFTMFEPNQFHELALGLELAGRPFLWVVRPDLVEQTSDAFPTGFRARVASHGRIVSWSPQQKVLAHPSVACFVTHCGWNSTMEGVTHGVPFLCWPYFTDQFLNRTYICDVWKNGLKVSADDKGLVSRYEFKSKLEELLSDDKIKARALELKDLAAQAVSEKGSSLNNFKCFVDAIKQ